MTTTNETVDAPNVTLAPYDGKRVTCQAFPPNLRRRMCGAPVRYVVTHAIYGQSWMCGPCAAGAYWHGAMDRRDAASEAIAEAETKAVRS